jgi:hypothetical protein
MLSFAMSGFFAIAAAALGVVGVSGGLSALSETDEPEPVGDGFASCFFLSLHPTTATAIKTAQI